MHEQTKQPSLSLSYLTLVIVESDPHS